MSLFNFKSKVSDLTNKKDGFIFFNNAVDKYSLFDADFIIDGAKICSCIDYIIKNNIKSIGVNPIYGGSIIDLNFLIEIPHIESITILQDNLDLSPINSLSKLKKLSFDSTKQKIDLENFPDLKILGCNYSNKIVNLEKAVNLEWAYIHNYKKDNLLDFEKMHSLKFLHFYNTQIKNLQGIGNLRLLEDFEIDKANNLLTLDGLSELNLEVIKFAVYNAKLLSDVNSIGKLTNLNKLYLQKISNIKSISFLKELKKLDTAVFGGFVIEDKVFSCLEGIKNVFAVGYKGNTIK